MKAIEISKNTVINFNSKAHLLNSKGQIDDLKIVQHEYDASSGQTTLVISSSMFDFDNYKLIVRDNQIGLVIMEHVEFSRPVYMHHYNWQNYTHEAYDRFHSASIQLPGERYHLVNHQYDADEKLLRIKLANSSFN